MPCSAGLSLKEMIDTHCHLDRCPDPDAAVDPSLVALVTVGTSLERSRDALTLAAKHPNVRVAVGVHPNEASSLFAGDVRAELASLAAEPLVVALGETGFDDHWRQETLAAQGRAVEWHAEVAAELDKALIFHVRDAQGSQAASRAAAAAVERAAASGVRRGVLHCFNGQPELLAAGLAADWWFSFAGNLTYRRAEGLREAALAIPMGRLVVETDSPYLTPEPLRGRPNTPANVRLTAAKLAEVLALGLDELESQLDANARELYRLDI